MPPSNYLRLHPDARLSSGEKAAFVAAPEEALEEPADDGGGDRRGSNRGSG